MTVSGTEKRCLEHRDRYGHGDRFEGLFFKGVFCGRGRYTWSDGGFYEGAYRDKGRQPHSTSSGKRNGYGVRWWVSGNRYEGGWLDDQMEGTGKFIGADGSIYTGPFRKNQKSGRGKEQWGNQLGVIYRCGMQFKHKGRGYCRYEGEYKNGCFHGPRSLCLGACRDMILPTLRDRDLHLHRWP